MGSVTLPTRESPACGYRPHVLVVCLRGGPDTSTPRLGGHHLSWAPGHEGPGPAAHRRTAPCRGSNRQSWAGLGAGGCLWGGGWGRGAALRSYLKMMVVRDASPVPQLKASPIPSPCLLPLTPALPCSCLVRYTPCIINNHIKNKKCFCHLRILLLFGLPCSGSTCLLGEARGIKETN